jgi:diguanylate cyclase (GGDEF)-like protein/PAS domain S-box-containing protein
MSAVDDVSRDGIRGAESYYRLFMTNPVHHHTAPLPHAAYVPQPQPTGPRRALLLSRVGAIGIAALGGLVLIGWTLGIAELRTLAVGSQDSINPTVALTFVVAAMALWLFGTLERPSREHHVARALAALVLCIGAMRLLGGAFGLQEGIDTLFFHDALLMTADGRDNRMTPAAAMNFLLLGSALLLLSRGEKARQALSQVLAIVAFVLGVFAVLGHLYHGGWFETIGEFNRMPLPTAIAFSLLAVGVLGLRHDSGVIAVAFSEGPGGTLARGLLPAGFLAPTIIGWIAIWALRAADGAPSGMKPELVVVLFVLAMIVTFVGLIAWNATQLHESHLERGRAGEALRDSEVRFRLLAENGSDVVSLHDLSGRVIYMSPSCERVLGFSPAEVLRMSPFMMVHPDDGERLHRHFDALIRGEAVTAISCRMLHKSGKHLWLEMLWRAVFNRDGKVVRLQASSRDVTERKEYERQLEEARRTLQVQQERLIEANMRLESLATLDGLTGLKNRRAFEARLAEELARSKRSDSPLSLLLLDIDHFKSFNDTFGHPRGDDVLRVVGRLLTRSIRDTDFVARYGGEEFAILLPDTDRDAAMQMGERLRESIEHAVWSERPITISVGAAVASIAIISTELLVDDADRALYRSKQKGRNLVTMAA